MNFSRHARASHHSEGTGIDMTPMVDTVLTLLIFFMVTTTFSRQSELKIQLPKAESAVTATKQSPLVLSIDARGHYYLNGRELVNSRFDTLFRALQQAKGTDGDKTPLVIRADVKTPYQAVVTAMDAAGQLGLSHLSIATDKTAPPNH
ncbi:hypothetical protein BI364_08650 [Acidihalobacter yilgarnensis]|uniref:Biopolymer transporter ExbD n=1 Tax=Acidihalobacter yilgarnensis TaxID=2819280 RepID=A0A1D8ING9_9GAMM|nr:biopolymer transporter ExbD [Acidihalobacter yilgarnensis]AOU98020.1 hypothetical protein BI364_08650 [Acidihalobacter yilgarnensis]